MISMNSLSGGQRYMAKSIDEYTEKATGRKAWYDRDLSKEEINSGNSSVLNRETEGADICRKVAEQYKSIAESNRSRYSTVGELTNAVFSKYMTGDTYKKYSRTEREAMARNEINMTIHGYVQPQDARNDPHLNGKVSKNTLISGDGDSTREFNIKTLGAQIMNVFCNNVLNIDLIKSGNYRFSVNSSSKKVSVFPLNENASDANLIEAMTCALNSKDNAKNLFYNLLYDGNQQGILAKNSLAKYKLYGYFREVTGRSMDEFKQTENGFVNQQGKNALEIFDEAIKEAKEIKPEYKGAAKGYFKTLIDDAMKYDMSETPELEVSLEYRGGQVYINTEKTHFDSVI